MLPIATKSYQKFYVFHHWLMQTHEELVYDPESVRCLCICKTMMLFKRDSVMVEHKYVLTRRIAEALRSETALVAGINKISFARNVTCDTRDNCIVDKDLKC